MKVSDVFTSVWPWPQTIKVIYCVFVYKYRSFQNTHKCELVSKIQCSRAEWATEKNNQEQSKHKGFLVNHLLRPGAGKTKSHVSRPPSLRYYIEYLSPPLSLSLSLYIYIHIYISLPVSISLSSSLSLSLYFLDPPQYKCGIPPKIQM